MNLNNVYQVVLTSERQLDIICLLKKAHTNPWSILAAKILTESFQVSRYNYQFRANTENKRISGIQSVKSWLLETTGQTI